MQHSLLLLETRLLCCFVAVAETGSLQRAGVRLGKAKSTVSRWLTELEEILGYQVFDRQSNGLVIVINPLGEALLPKVKNVLASLARLETFAFSQDPERVPAKLVLYFNQLVAKECIAEQVMMLRKLLPQTEIVINECQPDQSQHLLLQQEADLVLGFVPAKVYPDLSGLIVGEEQVMILAHPSHPLLNEALVDSQQLLLHTLIIPSFLQSISFQGNSSPFDTITTSDFELALTLAKSNLGIAYLPEHVARKALHRRDLCQLSINWEEFTQSIPLMLHFRTDFAYPDIKLRLVEGLREWFGYSDLK
ncbi:LysR family transcriptional regulator [Photobacterium sanguinicancri]|uniref:LysR family transcriptional regulator n=1 Tax=Photobacterium sanguinicancri TaxID=875932 RepID=A0AAW7Y015_9GAMM|nr:LysR family transcriptional regulator [Photobacterium sanguinicancri]MDO6541567.1 LysR family transcriptional regulator [Photobacterium sanguinicancri]